MSTHNLCFDQKYVKYRNFLSENFHFLVVKFSIYLNRHVFVMGREHSSWRKLPAGFQQFFHTFILSNFNFCPLSWHFCSKTKTNTRNSKKKKKKKKPSDMLKMKKILSFDSQFYT